MSKHDKADKHDARALRKARDTTASGIEANPMAALLGGLAIGAIAGVLLPRSQKERELLQPAGERINAAARAAIDAGHTAGSEALEEAGLSGTNVRSQGAKLFEQAIKVAGAAGTAAAGAARDTARR